MKVTKEQKFLYTRTAILIFTAGWIGFTVAGFRGFQFWGGGFELFFWAAFGLINYPRKTSLWLLHKRRLLFLTYYGALTGSFMLFDQFALQAYLWFYPFYTGPLFIYVYGVLYPVAALALIELFYFLANLSEESLTFRNPKATTFHMILDWAEGVLFLVMILLIAFGGAGYQVSLLMLFIIVVLWMFCVAVKLGIHIAHTSHILLLLLITGIIATCLNEFPNTHAFEWVYLEAPFLNNSFWNVPAWIWLGWFWYTLFAFRLWIFLVLHPRVK